MPCGPSVPLYSIPLMVSRSQHGSVVKVVTRMRVGARGVIVQLSSLPYASGKWGERTQLASTRHGPLALKAGAAGADGGMNGNEAGGSSSGNAGPGGGRGGDRGGGRGGGVLGGEAGGGVNGGGHGSSRGGRGGVAGGKGGGDEGKGGGASKQPSYAGVQPPYELSGDSGQSLTTMRVHLSDGECSCQRIRDVVQSPSDDRLCQVNAGVMMDAAQ